MNGLSRLDRAPRQVKSVRLGKDPGLVRRNWKGAIWLPCLALLMACSSPPRTVSRASDLEPPLEIWNSGVYLDGGTLGGEIVDVRGRRFPLCFDGRIVPVHRAMARHMYVGPLTRKATEHEHSLCGAM